MMTMIAINLTIHTYVSIYFCRYIHTVYICIYTHVPCLQSREIVTYSSLGMVWSHQPDWAHTGFFTNMVSQHSNKYRSVSSISSSGLPSNGQTWTKPILFKLFVISHNILTTTTDIQGWSNPMVSTNFQAAKLLDIVLAPRFCQTERVWTCFQLVGGL